MRNFFYFCLGLLISVGLFFMPYAHAQMAPYPSVAGPFSPYPPQYNPYLPNPATGAPSAASVANATGVAATQSGSATVTLPNGVKLPVPVSQTANIAKAAIARAAVKCLRSGPLAAVACAATAVAVANELSDRPVSICPPPDFLCRAPEQQISYPSGSGAWLIDLGNVYISDPAADCAALWQANYSSSYTGGYRVGAVASFFTCQVKGGWANATWTGARRYDRRGGVCPSDTAAVGDTCVKTGPVGPPLTEPEIEQTLQEKMDADYFANRRLYDAMKRDQANSPADYPAAADPVTNDTPVSVSAPPVTSPERDVSVTQSPKPDGSVDTTTVKEKTTVTPTTTGTTQGTVKTTYPSQTITTTTVTNNVTNNTATTINTTNNVPAVENKPDDEDYSFVDTGMPEVPDLYEQKYPDGISGVWRDNKPNIQGTQFWQGVKSMFPNFGGGQCPAWSMSFNITAASNFGTIPFDVPCWIWQAVGLIMMTTAAFTARKIIF